MSVNPVERVQRLKHLFHIPADDPANFLGQFPSLILGVELPDPVLFFAYQIWVLSEQINILLTGAAGRHLGGGAHNEIDS